MDSTRDKKTGNECRLGGLKEWAKADNTSNNSFWLIAAQLSIDATVRLFSDQILRTRWFSEDVQLQHFTQDFRSPR